MSDPLPAKGERLTHGLLYRRIPNVGGRWDPGCGLPLKYAFTPATDRETGVKETGISTYLVRLTTVEEVLEGHNLHFGVVVLDIAEIYRAVAELRTKMGTGKTKVAPFGEFSITFEPSDNPKDGAARHAHCWMNPTPGAVQKELVRLTSPSRVAKPCGPLQQKTGSVDP